MTRSPGTVESAVVFGAGENGASEARFTGTHSGNLRTPNGEIPATGNTVVSSYALVVRVENDRFTSFHIYFDVAELLGQLGLMQ